MSHCYFFNDRTIKLFGKNDDGQCNLNNLPKATVDKYPIQISCGDNHTGVLYNDGSYYFFGDNTYGQCDKYLLENKIERIDNDMHNVDSQIEDITNNGDVKVYKNNNKEKFFEMKILGSGNNVVGSNGWNNYMLNGSVYLKKKVKSEMLTSSSDSIYFKSLYLKPKGGTTYIACGSKHSAIVYKDGSISLFGHNGYGECASDRLPADNWAKQVACGGRHTAMLYTDQSRLLGRTDLDNAVYI
eukprot:Mrub_06523.p1 GENE.Mrub_06523~~Mrub_06523.p1  ORF type:complete len:242 (+),score=23.79 Mrub_06523:92-817(+)